MSAAPIITRARFPRQFRAYLDTLPPLAIPTPASIQTMLNRNVPRQWYETHSGAARLKAELALFERAGMHRTNTLTISGTSRTVLLRGCIDSKPLAVRGVPAVHSYAYIAAIPATYPYHFPILHFTSERHVTAHGPQLGPPYTHETRVFNPPGVHHYSDGHACICEHDSIAKQHGGLGWLDTHTLTVFLGWVSLYIACLEVYRETGRWPKDERVHAA